MYFRYKKLHLIEEVLKALDLKNIGKSKVSPSVTI